MRTRLLACLALIVLAGVPSVSAASAAGWRPVSTPRNSGLGAVACVSTRWCEAVGGWRERLTAARWNGARWETEAGPVKPRGTFGTLVAVACRSVRWCVAVGNETRPGIWPYRPLIERWNGARWSVQAAPSPRGYRAMNARLAAVACPTQTLCFAVGQAVPFGAGNAPGTALVERWNGRRWSLVKMPGTATPLTAISCTSARACTAVGGFEQAVGTPAANNQQVIYSSVIARWDGRGWSAESPPVPADAAGDVLNGVSCTSSTTCTAVGTAPAPPPGLPGSVPIDQTLVLTSTGFGWKAQTLPYPSGTMRQPATEPPSSGLLAVACQTYVSCAAVGGWGATNGDIGPLGAFWNGSTWAQTVIRRGPVQLRSIACPALGWCLAVGGDIAEQFIG